MSLDDLLAGGMPRETYGQGVRRRSRQMLVIFAAALVSALFAYATYSVSRSEGLTVLAAGICGVISAFADARVTPAWGETANRSQKTFWLVWFAPAFAILAAILIYGLSGHRDEVDLDGMSGIAWMLGMLTFCTYSLLSAERGEQ